MPHTDRQTTGTNKHTLNHTVYYIHVYVKVQVMGGMSGLEMVFPQFEEIHNMAI